MERGDGVRGKQGPAVGALHPAGSLVPSEPSVPPAPRYLLVLIRRHGGEFGLLEREGLHPLGRKRLDLRQVEAGILGDNVDAGLVLVHGLKDDLCGGRGRLSPPDREKGRKKNRYKTRVGSSPQPRGKRDRLAAVLALPPGMMLCPLPRSPRRGYPTPTCPLSSISLLVSFTRSKLMICLIQVSPEQGESGWM